MAIEITNAPARKLDLFVANPTKQVQDFAFFPINPDNVEHVVAHRHQAKTVKIQVGGQAKISDLEEGNLNFILRQHEQYGMIEASEVDRQRGRVALIYSVDKPVPPKAIEKAVHRNDQALRQLGEVVRQQAAVAAATLKPLGIDAVPDLKQLDVEVVEESSRDRRDDTPEINEGVSVTKGPVEAPTRRGRRQAA